MAAFHPKPAIRIESVRTTATDPKRMLAGYLNDFWLSIEARKPNLHLGWRGTFIQYARCHHTLRSVSMRKLVVLGCLLLSTQATIAQEQGREVTGPRAVLEYRDRPPVENR